MLWVDQNSGSSSLLVGLFEQTLKGGKKLRGDLFVAMGHLVAILSPDALRTHHLHTSLIPHAWPPFLIRNQNSLYTTHRTTYHITHHSSRVSYESSHDDNPIILCIQRSQLTFLMLGQKRKSLWVMVLCRQSLF